MPFRVLCAKLPKPGIPETLPETEAEHATRVLRLRDGDVIEALDGKGHAARVTLRTKGGQGPRIEYLEDPRPVEKPTGAVVPVTLEMAILKGEAMEWVVEKAVELGAQTLIPVVTAHTVVQIKTKGPEAFRDRWQKIADQALKQCGRLDQLRVETPIALQELIARSPGSAQMPRLWFDELARTDADPSASELLNWLTQEGRCARLDGVRILVGPEGGWNDSERKLLGAQKETIYRLNLGPAVLRAETAALYSLSIVVANFRQNLTKKGR